MELLVLAMFMSLFLLIFMGVHVAFALASVAFAFGYMAFGGVIISQLVGRVESLAQNFVLAAIPLFVFMGAILERSGIAERLFNAIRIWTRRLPGGVAVATILMCVVFAAATGIVGATEVVVGLLAIPAMMRYSYSTSLISGAICAGGSLGTIIPPSVVLIILGPLAEVSIGRLFAGAMLPGLLLAALYLVYVLLLCTLFPSAGPRPSKEVGDMPFLAKVTLTATAMVPAMLLVVGVLGSILFGLASPTEAAGIGAAGAFLISCIYGTVNLTLLREAILRTLGITSMIMFILLAGTMFTGVFFSLGGMRTISGIIVGLGLGPWEFLIGVLLLAFILGFFLEWVSILMIFIPIFTPIIVQFGFDPVWFCILFLVVIQTSYLTPPMAPAIFYLRGIAPPEISLWDMYVGVVPFLAIQLLTLGVLMMFPSVVLWLPGALFDR